MPSPRLIGANRFSINCSFRFSLLTYPPNSSGSICCTQRLCAQTSPPAGRGAAGSATSAFRPPAERPRGARRRGLGRNHAATGKQTTSPPTPETGNTTPARPSPPPLRHLVADPETNILEHRRRRRRHRATAQPPNLDVVESL